MDCFTLHRQPSEGFTCLASGRFISDSETECILAAASCSVHLFAIEKLGAEELIVPVSSLDVFGPVAQISCYSDFLDGDLALVLLKSGELKVLTCKDGRLQVLYSIQALDDLVDDYAAFITDAKYEFVAVGSRFGKIALLHFDLTNVSRMKQGSLGVSFHCEPRYIDLNKEKEAIMDRRIMREGIERLVSLELAGVPSEWPRPESFQGKHTSLLIWAGIESPLGCTTTTTRACTRVALVSFPALVKFDTETEEDAVLSFKTHWYEGHLPPHSIPVSYTRPDATDRPFLSLPQSTFKISRKTRYGPPSTAKKQQYFPCVSTSALCGQPGVQRWQIDESKASYVVSFNDPRRLNLGENDSEKIRCWHWQVRASSGRYGCNYILLGTESGRLYQLSLEDLQKKNEEFLKNGAGENSSSLVECYNEVGAQNDEFVEDAGLVGWNIDNKQLPIVLHPCGSVEGGIVAMMPLQGGRLVCITDEHALVLLRLNESSASPPLPPAELPSSSVDIMPTCSYSFVHCYQSAGSLVSCAKTHSNGVVMAVRGGSFKRLKEYSVPFSTYGSSKPNVSVAGEAAMELADEDPEKEKLITSGAKDAEIVVDDDATMNEAEQEAILEEDGEISIGGANAYGSPGALVYIYPDTLLEKMVEGKAGDVFGVTGLWPLKRCPTDVHHAAVLLASTGSARVLAVDGGCVFSDVTDSLQMVLDMETLAAGNLDLDDWVAQVTPSQVKAFHLDGAASSSSLEWHPPAGSTITSGAISSGFVIIQCKSHAQHSIVALRLSTGTITPELKQIGQPFVLVYEASCLGNIVCSTTNTHAALALGTYRPSILILQLDVASSSPQGNEQSWELLAEMSVKGEDITDGGFSWNIPTSPSAVVSTPEKRRKSLEYSSPQRVRGIDADWIPGSPLAAAARDQKMPHAAFKITTGTTLPSSIRVLPARNPYSMSEDDDYRTDGLELWVSSRSGTVHKLKTRPVAAAGEKEGAKVVCKSVCSLHHGELPPTLALMPDLQRVSPNFKILAVSDQASLLRASLHQGAIDELRLHTPGVACATPLVLEVPGGGDRLFLLTASTDGAFSLSSMEAHQRSKVIARPLPYHPDVIATSKEVPGVLAIAGRKWFHNTSPDGSKKKFPIPFVELFDANSGQSLSDFGDTIVLIGYETITGLALIPGNFWEAVREHLLTLPEFSGQSLDANAWAEGKYRCFILASTKIEHLPEDGNKDYERGRLLFFAVPLQAGKPFELLDNLYFEEPVLTVEYSGDIKTTKLHKALAIVSTGRRIVAYSITLDRSVGECFIRDASRSINTPARALQLCNATLGDRYPSIWIYAACEEGMVKLLLHYSRMDEIRQQDISEFYATIDVANFSPEVFDCVDYRSWSSFEKVSLESSGRVGYSDRGYDATQGHIGDSHPLSLVQSLEDSGEKGKEMLIVTCGGGVIELNTHKTFAGNQLEYKYLTSRGLLQALQRAIVEQPEFKLNQSVKKVLAIDKRRDVYKHPKPLVNSLDDEKDPERIATTAEGPLPVAISAEPALLDFLATMEESNTSEDAENDILFFDDYGRPREMLNLSVIRLFLDSASYQQRSILMSAVKKITREGVNVDVGAVVYELSQLGAHSMF